VTSEALGSLGLGGVLITLGYSAGRQDHDRVTDLIWKRARMAGFSLFFSPNSPTVIATALRDSPLPLIVGGSVKPIVERGPIRSARRRSLAPSDQGSAVWQRRPGGMIDMATPIHPPTRSTLTNCPTGRRRTSMAAAIGIAVLDDYQHAAPPARRTVIAEAAASITSSMTIWRKRRLRSSQDVKPFDVVCVMRERTPLTATSWQQPAGPQADRVDGPSQCVDRYRYRQICARIQTSFHRVYYIRP